jgi:hypothetical protein
MPVLGQERKMTILKKKRVALMVMAGRPHEWLEFSH